MNTSGCVALKQDYSRVDLAFPTCSPVHALIRKGRLLTSALQSDLINLEMQPTTVKVDYCLLEHCPRMESHTKDPDPLPRLVHIGEIQFNLGEVIKGELSPRGTFSFCPITGGELKLKRTWPDQLESPRKPLAADQ